MVVEVPKHIPPGGVVSSGGRAAVRWRLSMRRGVLSTAIAFSESCVLCAVFNA
jgi:hypothetical protein